MMGWKPHDPRREKGRLFAGGRHFWSLAGDCRARERGPDRDTQEKSQAEGARQDGSRSILTILALAECPPALRPFLDSYRAIHRFRIDS